MMAQPQHLVSAPTKQLALPDGALLGCCDVEVRWMDQRSLERFLRIGGTLKLAWWFMLLISVLMRLM